MGTVGDPIGVVQRDPREQTDPSTVASGLGRPEGARPTIRGESSDRRIRMIARLFEHGYRVTPLWRLAAATFTLLVTLNGTALSQAGPDSARALFVRLMERVAAPGGQLVVLRGGEAVVVARYGHRDSARVIPVTDTTLFRIGSISKLLTATAAARLWDSGRLDLDAPVERLVPEAVMTGGRVTPRLLAGHLGGVRHYLSKDFARPERHWGTVPAALATFAGDSLAATPGTRYLYSSYGYNLLGAAVERAAGLDFRLAVHQLVTGPMGLKRTHAQRTDSVASEVAWSFDPGPAEPKAVAATDLSDRWPSGGFLSNATEVAQFAAATIASTLLSARIRQLLFTPMTIDGRSTGVGFGWRVGSDPKGRTIYHHGGNSSGGRAMVVAWPAERLVVAITTNLGSARFGEPDAMAIGAALLPDR